MEVRAVAKYIKVQPRKVRIVADEVRGVPAQKAVDVLRFHPSKGAFHLRKVIASAFFRLTISIAIRSVEIEHGLFDARPGANQSPTFLSRDLPLSRECMPARREAR